MTKLTLPQDELEKNIALIKQRVRQKQTSHKHAPNIPKDLLITLSGCAFNVHHQEGRRLTLKVNKTVNFENNINELRVISYIAGVYDTVSIYGWEWRPTGFKKGKLYLRPVGPMLHDLND